MLPKDETKLLPKEKNCVTTKEFLKKLSGIMMPDFWELEEHKLEDIFHFYDEHTEKNERS